MAKAPATKPKHVPQRTCVICRVTLPKRGLIRVVRTPEGRLTVDARGKVAGRGAYLCPRRECFTSSRARSAVSRALEVDITEQEWDALAPELEKLAAERGPVPEQGAAAPKQSSL
jgi:uncharacterized protein